MKLANSGCGSSGRDFSSGWYWTPMNQGCTSCGILDRFGQQPVGRDAGEHQASFLELILIGDVDLVAVAVALGDFIGAIDASR
jgi:hypothetical protein